MKPEDVAYGSAQILFPEWFDRASESFQFKEVPEGEWNPMPPRLKLSVKNLQVEAELQPSWWGGYSAAGGDLEKLKETLHKKVRTDVQGAMTQLRQLEESFISKDLVSDHLDYRIDPNDKRFIVWDYYNAGCAQDKKPSEWLWLLKDLCQETIRDEHLEIYNMAQELTWRDRDQMPSVKGDTLEKAVQRIIKVYENADEIRRTAQLFERRK